MQKSYGLDLAGFSKGKSAFAKATFEESQGYRVFVYQTHPFSRKLDGKDLINQQISEERELILKLDPIYIDVPIDLENLLKQQDFTFAWQLTKRPVDFALDALPPLADRIGTPVARIKNVLREMEGGILGTRLFETYPKASLANILRFKPDYKAQTAEFSDKVWIGDSGLAEVLNNLGVKMDDGGTLNDDHVDAMICSLTGVIPPECLFEGEALKREVRKQLKERTRKTDHKNLRPTVPKGYRIIKKLPKRFPIRVSFVEEIPDDL